MQVRLNGAETLRRLTIADSRLLFAAPVSAAAGDAASELGFLIRRVERDGDIGVKTLLLRCIRPALRTRDGLTIARYNGILAVLRSIIGNLKIVAAASSPPASSPSSSSPAISALLRAIADVLTGVAEEDEGKDDIVGHQLHLALMAWVEHPQSAVRHAAVSALTQTSVGVKGKHACVRDGCVQLCVRRVKGRGAGHGRAVRAAAVARQPSRVQASEGDAGSGRGAASSSAGDGSSAARAEPAVHERCLCSV